LRELPIQLAEAGKPLIDLVPGITAGINIWKALIAAVNGLALGGGP